MVTVPSVGGERAQVRSLGLHQLGDLIDRDLDPERLRVGHGHRVVMVDDPPLVLLEVEDERGAHLARSLGRGEAAPDHRPADGPLRAGVDLGLAERELAQEVEVQPEHRPDPVRVVEVLVLRVGFVAHHVWGQRC